MAMEIRIISPKFMMNAVAEFCCRDFLTSAVVLSKTALDDLDTHIRCEYNMICNWNKCYR